MTMTDAPELPDAELRDWNIVTDCGKQFVTGAIFNDSKGRFVDGHRVRTSSVKYLNTITGICRTQNTVYKLTNELPWNTRAQPPVDEALMAFDTLHDLVHTVGTVEQKKALAVIRAALRPLQTPPRRNQRHDLQKRRSAGFC